ncbi:MAG: helix-turn-helix transcriptional regulator [Peptococcaceae bacterium]|jgi:DNA-binding HxlR family transcriptional regulator|nr:helix-turn-helix transcriptional regulator [Peptococcaceae bacterium]
MRAVKKNDTGQPAGKLLCPIRYMMSMFGGKWKLPIVCMLSDGTPLRYSSIKRKLGSVTNVMLSQSLKDLEAAGILRRKQYNEVPPRVEYTLTEKGKSVLPALTLVAGWAAEDMQGQSACGVKCGVCHATL